MLLAAAAAPWAAGRNVLDACAGVGVVALALSHLAAKIGASPRSVTALEIQAEACVHALYSAGANALPLDVVRGDLRAPPFEPGAFELIACNPPYRAVGTGRLAPHPARALGRHEIALTAAQALGSIARLLTPSGVAWMSWLAEREGELDGLAAAASLSVGAIVLVRPRADARPVTLLVRLDREKGVRRQGAEIVLHERDGSLRADVAQLLSAGDLSRLELPPPER